MPARLSRRSLLRLGLGTFAASTLGSVLSSCSATIGTSGSVRGQLPVHEDLRIDPEAPLERGAVLRVFEWRDYLDHGVLDDFRRRYADLDIDVEVESFTSMPEAIGRLRAPSSDFDVFFPVIDALPGLVEERLIRPLAHEALPHAANLWPYFRSDDGPFYDVGQRYSVPYTVHATGIGYRTDLVDPAAAPDVLANPYDAYWDTRHEGEIGLVDDYREVIAMALLRRGVDPNASSELELEVAVGDLIELAATVDLEVSTDGAYVELQTGEYPIQQAWSGDLLAAKRFGPGTEQTLDRTGFIWPSGGVVGCDLTVVCAGGRNPVLAHAFLDHLLEEEVALDNFAWNGYQPPIEGATREAFVDPSFPWHDLVPSHLIEAVLTPDEFDGGTFLEPLDRDAEAAWRDGWQRFLAATASSH